MLTETDFEDILQIEYQNVADDTLINKQLAALDTYFHL